MSSFTIDKKEYIKAAGVVAGLAGHYMDFWVYDYKSRRNSTAEDYYNRFVDCYRMNAISVQEQYRDRETEFDPADYQAEFDAYRRAAEQCALNGKTRQLLIELHDFFRSALYQTEKEDYSIKMELYFSRIFGAIFEKINTHEVNSWGTLEIDHITQGNARIERIM